MLVALPKIRPVMLELGAYNCEAEAFETVSQPVLVALVNHKEV